MMQNGHARPRDPFAEDAIETARQTPPGQQALALAAVIIGVLLMGIQLWLLTVALELFLSGEGHRGWLLALVSGLIFLGGLLMLRLMGRRPRQASGRMSHDDGRTFR